MMNDKNTYISPEEQTEYEKAKAKALTLLSYKEYTSGELTKRLQQSVSPKAAEQAVERMVSLGFINDEDYAERYAGKLAAKGFGEWRIRMEMRRKGLDPDTIDFTLDHLEADPVEQAREVLEKKYPLWQEDERVKRRAYGALARRGFRPEEIRQAMTGLEFE